MNQQEFTRRMMLKGLTAAAAMTATGGLTLGSAQAAGPLKLWTIGLAKVGAKDWSAMEAQAGI